MRESIPNSETITVDEVRDLQRRVTTAGSLEQLQKKRPDDGRWTKSALKNAKRGAARKQARRTLPNGSAVGPNAGKKVWELRAERIAIDQITPATLYGRPFTKGQAA